MQTNRPVFLEAFDYEAAFRQIVLPTVINDLPYTTDQDKKNFTDKLLLTYQADSLSGVPSCACGTLRYGYNVGLECSICQTVVEVQTESPVELRTWIRVPDGVTSFISPFVWIKLTKLLNKKGFNLLDWLANPKVNIPVRKPSKVLLSRIEYFESIQWKRGLNEFVNRYDEILEAVSLFTKGYEAEEDIRLLKHYRHLAFTKVLPLPPKQLMILETLNYGSKADNLTLSSVFNAAKTIVKISQPKPRPLSLKFLEDRAFVANRHIIDYCVNMIQKNLSPKKGWLRSQVFSGRMHFTARGVITSIPGHHTYQELWLPWAQGLELLKIHLISKLVKKHGHTEINAYSYIESKHNIFDELLYGLMKEIIKEAGEIPYVLNESDELDLYRSLGLNAQQLEVVTLPKNGLQVLFQRNPSLDRGSAQFLFVPHIKRDIHDKTISISNLDLVAWNSDFDGDEMNLTLLPYKEIQDAGASLQPHFNIHDAFTVGEISKVCKLPDVTVSTLANYIRERPQ